MKKVNVLMVFALVAMLAAALVGSGHAYAQSATPSVDASDQAAGSSLTVAKVVAAQDGWITVHANTADNKPGDQLGHTMVKAGENDNVVVQLSPAPKAGDKVWPMLHIDAGVIGTYEFPGPDAPVIIDGNIVMKQITLTAAATSGFATGTADSVAADDQPAGSTVVVKHVHANQDGFITIHANTADNKPGAQLGHAAVKKGDNENVVVQVSPATKAGDKVWPMLHIDAGVIGTYEFPGPDAPVIIDGNIIMQQISITGAMTSGGSTTSGTTDTGTMPAMPKTGNGFDYTWLIVLAAMALASGFGVRRLAHVRARN